MPLQRCSLNGKKGWKWGEGKCYTGPGGREKALKQMRATKSQSIEEDHIIHKVSEVLKEETNE